MDAARASTIDTAIVDAVGVAVRLGTVPILRDLDLAVHPGEVVAVTGPNGSGKSTLLRLLATLLRPSSGRLELFGMNGRETMDPDVRRRIGHVGHEPALHPDLAVDENLHLVARLAGYQPAAVDRALSAVGLAGAAGRPVRACSSGMRRRAELARILLCRPHLLLLDEAHAALDATSRDLVDRVTMDVIERGGGAVLVTHDPDAVAPLADRLLRLSQGRLVTEEPAR